MAVSRLIGLAAITAAHLSLSTNATGQGFPSTPASRAEQPSGLILGTVVDGETGKPIPRAVVEIGRADVSGSRGAAPAGAGPLDPPRVLTDNDGRFLFRGLSAGSYSLTGSAPNYLDGGHGQHRPMGLTQPFVLQDHQRAGNVVIRLWKAAVVSGTVTDETGAPAVGIAVRLDPTPTVAAAPPLGPRPPYWQSLTLSDDRGHYEISGIPPGHYVASVAGTMTTLPMSMPDDGATLASLRGSATPALASGLRGLGPVVRVGGFFATANSPTVLSGGSSTRLTHTTTFHPAASSVADATILRLRAGDARNGVDIRLRPVSAVSVSGNISGPAGPLAHFAVHLMPAEIAGTALEQRHEAAVTIADATGRFVFPAVTPGRYVVKAWRLQPSAIGQGPLPAERTLWGLTPVTVGETPVTSIAVVLRTGAMLRGRVVFDGSTSAPIAGRVQTAIGAAFAPAWPLAVFAATRLGARVTPTGDFVTQGVPPGRLTPNFTAPLASLPGWHFESATLNGRDLTIAPLALDGQDVDGIVLTFTDQPATVSGVVAGPDGRPSTSAVVIVFPADYEAWIESGLSTLAARVATASQTAEYTVTGVPRGNHIVAATTEDTLANWQPATIRALAAAGTRISLQRGESRRVNLRTK
jgi:protocatechuate 3,4-dioxygenase beta subunit